MFFYFSVKKGESNMRQTAYQKAGVDIEAGKRLVEGIRPLVASTRRPEVLGALGGFSGLFALEPGRYKAPVLVSGTDGVGTKLQMAQLMGRHDTVGIDLVAMCVNDVVVCGAEPLFFLDYFSCGTLLPEVALEVVKGISAGCREAGCALVGGETAEMPAFYPPGAYDLAGFSVGVVEKDQIIDGHDIAPGDLLIGLASSGLHSNAYSLTRKILLEQEGLNMDSRLPGLSEPLGEVLLRPTTIYVRAVLSLLKRVKLKGLAHITGGGITDNLPRMLPQGLRAEIDRGAWPIPPIFSILQEKGAITPDEMLATFNMGIGMILALAPSELERAKACLKELDRQAFVIGRVLKGDRRVCYV